MKRVIAMGDLHCGSRVGLTPTLFEGNDDSHFAEIRREVWKFYERLTVDLQPVHCLIVNGDLIDGKGERSGGTELIEPDRIAQCDMAAHAIKQWNAEKIIITAGTPYHAGSSEDFEEIVADRVVADEFGGHAWVDVDGVVFDVKHKVGGSVIPHGRATAVKREVLWNTIWSEDERQIRADILLRSHVHYFEYSGNGKYLAMTLPALQGYGSKYGVRQCSGVVDIGLVEFNVEEDGTYSWRPHLLVGEFLKAQKITV
jgi:hypothetical protein